MRRLFLFLTVGLFAIALFGAGALAAVQVVDLTQGQMASAPMAGPMSMMAGSGGPVVSPAQCNGQHAAMHGRGMMGNGMMGNGMMPEGMQPGSCPFQATPAAGE
jgi:hypothetical protein